MGAVVAAALTVLVVTPAGAAPAAGKAPQSPAAAARALPAVSRTWTDGQSEQALYRRAVSLVDVSQHAAPLQARIAASKARIDADAVQVTRAAAAAHAAEARAASEHAVATAAAKRYAALAASVRNKAIQLYMGNTVPSGLAVSVKSGSELAIAADYLEQAVGPGAPLAERRQALATDVAATHQADAEQAAARRAQARATASLRDEQHAAAALEADLTALDSGHASAAARDHAALTAQVSRNLDSPDALEFKPAKPLPTPLATTTTALTWAFAELGTPYLWGGTGPEFDCSGLTQFVWKKAGVTIPRVAADQDAWTDPVPLSQLTPGDLVFYGTTYIHHVGIYIGDGLMINAPHTGTSVQVSSIWWADLAGFGRVHAEGAPVASHQLPSRAHPLQPVVRSHRKVPSQPGPPLPPRRGRAGKHAAGGTTSGSGIGSSTTTTTSPTTPTTGPGRSGTSTTTSTTTGSTTTSSSTSTTTTPPTTAPPTTGGAATTSTTAAGIVPGL